MANRTRQSRNRLVFFTGQLFRGFTRIVSAARCSSSMNSEAALGLSFCQATALSGADRLTQGWVLRLWHWAPTFRKPRKEGNSAMDENRQGES